MLSRLARPYPARQAGAALALALCVAVLGPGTAGFLRKATDRRPDDGVTWRYPSGGPAAGAVRAGGPGDRAGIRPGDRLRAIDRVPVGDESSLLEALWRVEAGETPSYSLTRAGVEFDLAVSVGSVSATPALYSYLALVGLFFLLAGLVVFLRLPADPAARVFLGLCLCQFLLLVYSPTGRAEGFDWFLFWGDQVGRLFVPALLLHLSLRFPRRSPRRSRFPLPLYLPAAALFATRLYLVGSGAILRRSDPAAILQRLDRLELATGAAFLFLAVFRLIRSYLGSTEGPARDRVRWVAFGAATGLLPFTLLYLLPRGLGFGVGGAWELTAIPMVLLPLSLAAAIAGPRVVELDFHLKRGIRFLSFAFLLFAAYLAASITLTGLLGPFVREADRAAAVLAGVGAALLVGPLRRLSRALVDHLFYSSRYDLRRTLREFARDLSVVQPLGALARAFTERIRRSLEVEAAAVLVRDEPGFRFRPLDPGPGGGAFWDGTPHRDSLCRRDFLETGEGTAAPRTGAGEPFTLLIPMRVRARVVAVLAVRGSGSAGGVGREDRALLVGLCGQVAGALESARLHDELQERMAEVDRLRRYSDGILESSRIGILVVGPRGNIRAWNGAMSRLTGVDRREAVGRPAAAVFPEGLLRRVGAFETLSGPGEGRRVDRFPLGHPDGSRRLVSVTASPLGPQAGAVGGTVLTFDDVTEQARMQEELGRRERMASVGLLAAGVAHEVNTPLTGIASYAQMLLQGPRSPEEHRMLRQIESQAFRASQIANRLLDLARADGDLHEVVEVNPLVRETLALFAPQVRGREIRIEAELEAIPEVVGHRGRLQQVLLNLLWNAVDALPAGGRIRVSTHRFPGEVRLSVRDDGVGIPPEHLSRVFDPFFSTKQSRGGTGLGLSVSFGIVREHGGRIEAESDPGSGSCFHVCLPYLRERARRAG
ncbi:MAG: PAS domain S-box protein [Acidobacteria bacterium]|nr:PAS domain S-box protein [Acidobacteriota bacterium]